MADDSKIVINVPMSSSEASRFRKEEHFWTSGRLVALTFVTLTLALILLWFMAQSTSETTWSDWLIPG